MKVVCAWCGKTLKDGSTANGVSHGICPACEKKWLKENVALARADGSLKSENGYLYHCTNVENAHDIAREGLKTFKPDYGTDQASWPDGKTSKRAYFSPNAHTVWQFAPENGKSVILRVKRSDGNFKNEIGTGDVYTNDPIPASKLEIMKADGTWMPLKNILTESVLAEAKMLPDEARKILGLPVDFSTDQLKAAYRTAAVKAHPDHGGSLEDMKLVNVAKDTLEKIGASHDANASWKVDWEAINARVKHFQDIAESLIRRHFNSGNFIQYFETLFGEKFTGTVKYSRPTSAVTMTAEFIAASKTVAFEMNVYINVTDLLHKKILAAPEEMMDMGIMTDILVNRKKIKLTRNSYQHDSRYAVLQDPKLIFPEAGIKAQVGKSIVRKFSKRDAILTFEKELGARIDYSGGTVWAMVPVNGLSVAFYRTTIFRQGGWSTQGVYSGHKRIATPKIGTFVERQEDMDFLFDRLRKLQNGQVADGEVLSDLIGNIVIEYRQRFKS